MTYVRLPTTLADYPVGKNDLKQQYDNQADIYNAFALKHGVGIGASPWSVSGHHSDPLVVKTVLRVSYTAGGLVSFYGTILQGPGVAPWEWITSGLVYVGIVNLTNVYAAVAVDQSSTTPVRFGTVTYQRNTRQRSFLSTPNYPTVMAVRMFERDTTSGYFNQADMGFTLTVYGVPT